MRKSSFITLLVSFTLTVCNYVNAQTAVAPTGTGTTCDPYQISSLNNLCWMTQTSASWVAGKYFIQTANIDASATSTWFLGQGLPVIGTFSANYDGREYTISNITINRTGGNRGIFGSLSGAIISNLNISNPAITFSSGADNAILAGNVTNSTIKNVDVIGGSYTYTGTSTSQGGFIATVKGSVISSCSTSASVTSSRGVVGGFVGRILGATTFSFNYSNSTILINGSTDSYRIGGFVGQSQTTEMIFFNNCYSLGSISSSGQEIGGFIGMAFGYNNFNNCYSRSTINASHVLSGGFVGGYWSVPSQNNVVFNNCYSTGSVVNALTGGFGPTDQVNISYNNCFWDTQTSGKTSGIGSTNKTGLTGKTTAEMKTQTTFTIANWDFNNVWEMSNLVNDNYPNLVFPTVTLTPLLSGVNSGTVSSNQVVCYNTSPSNIILSGSCGSIQWQSSMDNSTWTNISVASAATLTAAQMGVSNSTRYFRAVLTGNSNTAYSDVVTVEVNNGLGFDGTGDFVSLGNHAHLNFTNNFTIETWLKVPTIPSSGVNTIFSKKNPTANTPGYMFGFNNSNTSDLKLVFESAVEIVSSNRPIIAGEWNHVAVVISANGTLATFYINGVVAGSSSITLSDATSLDEFIGAMDLNGTNSLNGTLDELRIWNVARTQQELIDNIDNPLIGNETGLVAYFDFNQGIPSGTNTGLTLFDQTSNGIVGSFNGFALVGTNSNFVQGNHLSIISPDATVCLASSSPKLIFGGTGKTPTAFQWYSNTAANTSGATLIAGAILSYYNAPTSVSGTSHYYLGATGTCASSITSNFAKVIVSGGIIGNDFLYLDNTGNYTSTETPSAINPWVISNTNFATTTYTGVLTGVSVGSPILTFTSASGCVVNKTISIVPTIWKGTTNSNWNIGSNWNGSYVPTTVTNLVFDNAVVNDCDLDQDRTLTSLKFGSGSKKLSLGNYNLTVTSISENGTTRFVKTNGTGKLSLTVDNTASVVFPIGNSSYNAVTIKNNSGASDVFAARVVDAVYLNGSNSYTFNFSPIVNRTWDISKTNSNSGSGIDFVFNWNNSDVINGPMNSYVVNHFNGTTWEIPTVTSSSYSSNSLAVVGYTGSFSPFAISETTSALPVELTAFNANCTENATTINWQTASEHNSATFEVEKSRDGSNWALLAVMPAAGNSSSILDYSVVDNEKASAIVYYRLNQIDVDGVSKMYDPISANCNDSESFDAMVYPNPTNGDFSLALTSNKAQTISIQLIGIDGKTVFESKRVIEVGTSILPMKSESLKVGVYTLLIQSENTLSTEKIIIQ